MNKIKDDGFQKFFTWNKSVSLKKLYTKRVRKEVCEMDSCKQASQILKKIIGKESTILDVACGTGYLFHSLKKRIKGSFKYYGIDANPEFVEVGNKELKRYVLYKPIKCMRIEDFVGNFDHIFCLNFLSNIDNYHKILERLLLSAKESLIVRESLGDKNNYKYVKDKFLDSSDLSVYVNTYKKNEFIKFIESYGFEVKLIKDKRTNGEKELVIDYPHYWHFILAKRKSR